eukprot:gene53658-biopygen16616
MWGMGVLLYELTVGSHPFSSASEVATYSKISSFGSKSFPALKFPDNFAPEAKSLINQLLVPTPEARIGGGGLGFTALKKHAFFKGINWEEVDVCNESSPLFGLAQREKVDIQAEGLDSKVTEAFAAAFDGDAKWLGTLDD